MGRLAMNLAHEIRNPLNAAVLQLHLLGRQVEKLDSPTDTKEGFRSRIRIVGDEIGRLNRLLTEFLELARPRSILREPVHVSRLVEDVLDLEAETARARNVTIVRDVAAEGVVAIGDREKLKQVVLNVVVNALEAMKDGGRLTARVTGDGDRVTFVLEDDGPGILDEHRATVFDPFFTTKEAGTGLGLSIVRKIVDQHAGTITLESLPVRGTRVVVTIPDGRAPTARGSSGLLPEG
jgi:signal transduction histidine kinase